MAEPADILLDDCRTIPDDWRTTMVDMIRGAAPLDDVWFTGGPVCTPLEQIGIYATQYRLRLYDALIEEIPGTMYLLDEPEELLRRFLAEHPSTSWTLNRVADGLWPWLEQQQVEPYVVDMARLDFTVQQGFEAAEAAPLDPAALAGSPALYLQPHTRLLRLGWNVQDIRSCALTGQAVPDLQAQEVFLVVFRRGLGMRHIVLEPGAWWVLQALDQHHDIGAALDSVVEQGQIDPDALGRDLGQWFQLYAELGLLTADPLS